MDRALLIWPSLAALLVASPRASAQTDAQGLELQWNAPAACMSPAAARAEITKLVRPDRGEGARARVLIEGTPQTGYVAEIEIARGTSSGERTLRGARCLEVAEAAVLIVAMVIDPEAANRAAASSGQPKASSAPPSASPPASEPSAAARADANEAQTPSEGRADPGEPDEQEEADEREAPEDEEEPDAQKEQEDEIELEEPSDPRAAGRYTLGVLGGGDAGSLPALTVAGGLFAGIAWPRTRLELRALAYLPQVEALGPARESSAEISLYSAALAGCAELLGARDEDRALGACAAVEAGLSSGAPRGVTDGRRQDGFWLAGLAGVDVRQRLAGPLHVRLYAEAGVPIFRPYYRIEPFGGVFRASPILGRFGFSAFVLFP